MGLVHVRQLMLMVADAGVVALAVLASYMLRFDGLIPAYYWVSVHWVAMVAVAGRIVALAATGLYRRVWAYASLPELFAIVMATTAGSAVFLVANSLVRPFVVPRSVIAIEFLLSTAGIGAVRLLLRLRWDQGKRRAGAANGDGDRERRILIIGAGDAGAMAVREIRHSTTWRVIGFIDDDRGKHGKSVYGVPVLGGRERIAECVRRYGVNEILIAIPSAPRAVIRELVEASRATGVEVRILPALYELMDGRVTVQQIREVRIEDLLGREPVKVDQAAIASYLRGRRVLVTGAGGSIGSELCRQVARYGPKELVLMGHGENSVFEIDLDLGRSFPGLRRALVIGDVRDGAKVQRVFERWRPEVVFHAAAHKHVPLMEANPEEAVTNNVLGTFNVIEAAMTVAAERFVLISTDKAVRPVSAMGASKRVAEMLVQVAASGAWGEVVSRAMQVLRSEGAAVAGAALLDGVSRARAVHLHIARTAAEAAAAGEVDGAAARRDVRAAPKTRFVVVRFGNVIGSRGSVVQIFKRQIAEGGPVAVTDPEMRRYFMTIPEAVQLVIQAGALGKGGEVFVLDMGEPVRILDLARDMVRLSGFEPDVDIPIRIVGARPGEKVSETLVGDGETIEPTDHPKILRLQCTPVDPPTLGEGLGHLLALVEHGSPPEAVKAALIGLANGPGPESPSAAATHGTVSVAAGKP